MNYREKMKEYLKEPDEYSSHYGKWGILNKEQRDLIKRLLNEMDNADDVIRQQFFEIENLNDKYEQRERKWEKWNTEKQILSSKMSDYLCKYQNLKREYTKQTKILSDRKKENEELFDIVNLQEERINELNREQMKLNVVSRNDKPVKIDNYGLDYMVDIEQRLYKANQRVNEAIDFVETEYNTYPSGKEWRKALLEILKGEK